MLYIFNIQHIIEVVNGFKWTLVNRIRPKFRKVKHQDIIQSCAFV